MSKRIKTNNNDIGISTTTIEVVSINGISFEHDEELPCVSIYIVGDGDKEFYEEVESQGIVGFEDLKRFALNWYFDNVEIVREISSCIGEGRNTVDLRGALEEVRLNLMAIDMNGDPGVGSFVNDSIEIINEALKTETAQEVSVQEQSRFVPEDSNGKYPQSVGEFITVTIDKKELGKIALHELRNQQKQSAITITPV